MLTETDRQNVAHQELARGENLLWTGAPDPGRGFWGAMLIWIFAIPWTLFSLFWMLAALAAAFSMSPHGFWGWALLFPLFGVPFVLIGFAMLASPWWAARKAKRTVYALTTKRILIIESGKTSRVESYDADDLGDIKRVERADGSGDLTFAQRVGRDSDGDRTTINIKFSGIRDVRAVETMLRHALGK